MATKQNGRDDSFDDRQLIIDQTSRRRIVVNPLPKIGAAIAGVGIFLFIQADPETERTLYLIGGGMNALGIVLQGFTSRQFNRSSQDNRIR